MLLQAQSLPRVRLKMHLQWSRYYGMMAVTDAEEHAVTQLEQLPKPKGSGHDTWLTCPDLAQNFGNDCLVQVARLHPTVNGFQQVDKAKVSESLLAIRAPVYNASQIHEIENTIAEYSPSIQKVRQVVHSKVLHELTVYSFSGTDLQGSRIEQSVLEEMLRTAGPAASPLASADVPGPSSLHAQVREPPAAPFEVVLPSTVIGSKLSSPRRDFTNSSASTSSDEVRCWGSFYCE